MQVKGNVMDPLVLIDDYRAPTRCASPMTAMSGQARDIKLFKQRIEGYRNFGTKLWNASRFAQMNECVRVEGFDPAAVKQPINRWIRRRDRSRPPPRSRRALAAAASTRRPNALYRFIWNVFCDWYCRAGQADPQRRRTPAAKAETRATAAWALDVILQACCTRSCPFITEELWDKTAEFGAPARAC